MTDQKRNGWVKGAFTKDAPVASEEMRTKVRVLKPGEYGLEPGTNLKLDTQYSYDPELEAELSKRYDLVTMKQALCDVFNRMIWERGSEYTAAVDGFLADGQERTLDWSHTISNFLDGYTVYANYTIQIDAEFIRERIHISPLY